jgi:hypothetical protein
VNRRQEKLFSSLGREGRVDGIQEETKVTNEDNKNVSVPSLNWRELS